MKFPFSTKSKDAINEPPAAVFSAYCAEELERLRDSGQPLDESRFQAAVNLALERLRHPGGCGKNRHPGNPGESPQSGESRGETRSR